MKKGLFIYAGFLLLLSCQQNTTTDVPLTKEYNRSDAAALNTQLGLAYLKQGNRPRAKRKLMAALSQAPESANVNAALAYFLEKTGEFGEAETYYKKAMTISPGSGAQLNNYGAFLCRRGQYNQAEEYFLKAVRDIKYENTAGAYENAGLCALEIPDEKKARLYFTKALEQDPARKQSLYELVRLEMKQNNYQKVLADLQKYPKLTLREPSILELAVNAAQKSGKAELEADYKMRLQQIVRTKQESNL